MAARVRDYGVAGWLSSLQAGSEGRYEKKLRGKREYYGNIDSRAHNYDRPGD